MKTTSFFVAVLLYATFTSAQIDHQTPWTWVKGDNIINQQGVYGTCGVTNAASKPGARNSAATWKDNNGHLWLFGGSGYGTSSTAGYLNDLWKYDPAVNKWAWMKGDNIVDQYSDYGIKGTANAANKPGAAYASVSWTDKNGNLWLFGGFGYTHDAFGFLNSLWKYNSATNDWTWIKGDNSIDQPGIYGSQGIPAAGNTPGARYGSQTWTDASGHLWLYGGFGFDESNNGILNDIWKYNPSTNQWTWVNGDKLINQKGEYGSKGVTHPDNKPGARYVSTSWTDNGGNFWIFGGYGYDGQNPGNLNDLWKYNTASNQWTWVSGDKLINQTGEYGSKGVTHPDNKPGARYISTSWTDAGGELWLFGGYGYGSAHSGYLNDLWKYKPATNEWTWIKGDNTVDQVGVYGTQGMAAPSNKSGARVGSVSWTDGTGSLWLFGGEGFDGSNPGTLNDLWKINNMQGVLPIHLLNFSGVLNNETVYLQWQSEQEKDFSHFNIQRSFDGNNFTTIATMNGTGNSNPNHYNYNDNDLQNRLSQKAFYRLELVDRKGNFTYSRILRFDFTKASAIITAFPNPAINSLNLSFEQSLAGKVIISITGINGITLKKLSENIPAGRASIHIDVSTLSSATYILTITKPDGTVQLKFIKQ